MLLRSRRLSIPLDSYRFCAVRVDGLHYYDKEGGDRLGVIERTRIEDCILLENGKTFDLLCNDGVVLEFTVTDATQASKWVDVLKPKKVVADKEGWLFKKKEKKGLTTAISRSKKRWCVLSSDSFKYFENKEGGGRCLGALPLQEMTASLIGEGESQTIRLMHGKESYAFASCPDGGPPLAEWVNSINRLTALLKTQTPIIRKSGNSKSSQNSSAVNPANKMKQSPPRSVGVASSVKKPEGTVSQRGQEDDGEEENFVNEQFEAEPVRSPRGKVSVPRVSGAAAAKRKLEAEAARQRELEAAEELSSEEPIPIDYGNDYQDSAEISADTPAGRAAPVARNSGRGGRVVSRASKDSPGAPRGRGVASNRISRIPEKKLPETMYVENDHLLDEDSSE